MTIKPILGISLALAIGIASCTSQKNKFAFKSPDSGVRVAYGESVRLSLNFPTNAVDSVVYSIDGSVIETKSDTSSVVVDMAKYGFGDRSISARLYAGGQEDIAYSNVIVIPPPAKNYAFEVVNTFPHDTKAFTQGLQYADGVLYESTGRYGESTLRKVDLQTGKVLKSISLEDKYFGEGMTIVDDQLIVLTWQEHTAFFYDKANLTRKGSFSYGESKEGWGLTYDGQRLIKSDGTHRLYFLNAKSGAEEGSVAVYDENGPVNMLNELEYIDGKVYANVYGQEIIVIINPHTGAVEGRINLVGMYNEERQPVDNELNGIAYDASQKRLFVTGKLWSKLFEIKLIER